MLEIYFFGNREALSQSISKLLKMAFIALNDAVSKGRSTQRSICLCVIKYM